MQPTDNKRYLGLEIEFYTAMPRETVELVLAQHLKSASAFHAGSDGSIRTPTRGPTLYYPVEVRILLRQTSIDKVMAELKAAFKAIKPKVNQSCGLHVHIDARNRNKDVLFNNLVSCQDIFFMMQPKVRRDNNYCRRNSSASFEYTRQMCSRYQAINAQSYFEHKTIEVRLHKGSVNPDDIGAWMKVLVKVAARKRKLEKELRNVVELKETFKFQKDADKYVTKCVQKYNKAS
jgi:hypothetical protein